MPEKNLPEKESRLTYLDNMLYAFLAHPTGITRPNVWLGHFYEFEPHQYQKRLFNVLRKEYGFSRTPFQVVFPGQIAGLIKRLDDEERSAYSLDDEIDEAHVRFYIDGTVSCELEPNRFNPAHYQHHVVGTPYLEQLVQSSASLTPVEKKEISSQIEYIDFGEMCAATDENPSYQKHSSRMAFAACCTALMAACYFREIVEPLFVIGANLFLIGSLVYRPKKEVQNQEVAE